jgi:tetratricopeptide (TPR) repeat protein/class 3 adenylate cyclase
MGDCARLVEPGAEIVTDERMRQQAAERWQRIQEVLAEAIEAEGDARRQLVADRCAHDGELAIEVETLLAAHERAGLVDRLADAIAPARSWARARAMGWEGRRVAQYLVADQLGAGGMGLVYKAHDERLGRHVALKFLSPHLSNDPAAKERFLVEARAAAALDHPNVCTIHEIGETEDGKLFMTMPLYDGETLRARLQRGPLAFADAVPIALQVARALACAHERGIVHCDVKPSNVMLLTDGTPKVLDFGVATMDDVSSAGHVAPIGTVAYMSPEQIRGSAIDHRTDIWSLGIVLHEMLTGTRPFDGDDRRTMVDAILTKDPSLVATSDPNVPAGVDHVLRRALARDPEDRYPSMEALAIDLSALQQTGHRVFRMVSDLERLSAGERRRAAVLVTVVSECGALFEHLAPSDAHRVVARIQNLAVDVVRRHGGLVNQAIGGEVVSMFGVPAAHEDDELRSVRAAIELHARVAELTENAADLAPVRVQSGLHVGPVVAHRLNDGPQRYAIVGAPPQVASRLAAHARPGQILLSSDCQRLVAPFVHVAACASVMLEPEGQPLTPFCVIGETGLETRFEASERLGLTPYVGRQSELALLHTHVDRARRGEGSEVVIVGEAGAGKSRLLHELRERVDDGVRFLHGRCRGYEVAPYCPFIDIVRDTLDLRTLATGESRDVVDRIRAIDPSLDRFLPLYLHLLLVPSDQHPLPRHLHGEHLHAALLDALAAMVAALADQYTVVVLLEDWHWADAASRSTLERMAEVVTGRRVLFVVTSRPERGTVNRWSAHARIPLDPLDYASSITIMRSVLGVEHVSDALARRLFERSGGNPFFLEQLCCALREQDAVDVRDGEAVVRGASTLSLPETVQAVIRTRLDTLEPNARELLRVAAVIGREFQHAVLAEVLDPSIDLTAAVVRLKAAGLIQLTAVRPDVTYRFTHVLAHEVSYESLLSYQRKSLHEAIGRAIESRQTDRTDDAAVLAHHFECAGVWPQAICYGRRAAERASALSQFADALVILDRVLTWLEQLPDDDARRDLKADVLLQYERACETLGLRSRQREIIEQLVGHLAPHGSSRRLAESHLRQGDLLTLLRRFDAADRSLTIALRISREHEDAALERHILRSIGLLRWHEGRFEEARALAVSALTIDRERGDEPAVAGDLANLGNILKCMGDYPGALQRLEEALAMPALARDPKKSTYALHKLANVHRAMGNLESALACLHQADEICRVHLLPIQRSFHLTSIAHIQLQQGSVDSSLRTYEKAVALSRRARHAEGLANSLRPFGEVLFALGTDDEALPILQEAALLFAQLEDPASEAEMWKHAAAILERKRRPEESIETWKRVDALCGQLGDARGRLDALEGIARSIRQHDPSSDASIAALEAALHLAATLGDPQRALALRNTLGIVAWERGRYTDALNHYQDALRLAREHGNAAQQAVILNSLGVTLMRLQRPTDALTALEEGLARSRASGERILEAHASAALGQLYRTIGDLGRALERFEQSLEIRRVLNDRTGQASMLRRIAETTSALGNSEAASRAAAAAAGIAAETAMPNSSPRVRNR